MIVKFSFGLDTLYISEMQIHWIYLFCQRRFSIDQVHFESILCHYDLVLFCFSNPSVLESQMVCWLTELYPPFVRFQIWSLSSCFAFCFRATCYVVMLHYEICKSDPHYLQPSRRKMPYFSLHWHRLIFHVQCMMMVIIKIFWYFLCSVHTNF